MQTLSIPEPKKDMHRHTVSQVHGLALYPDYINLHNTFSLQVGKKNEMVMHNVPLVGWFLEAHFLPNLDNEKCKGVWKSVKEYGKGTPSSLIGP